MLQALEEWEDKTEQTVTVATASMQEKESDQDMLLDFDEDALNGIMESIAAFQKQ